MPIRCTFCGEAESPARRLVSAAAGASICRECAELAVRVLDEPEDVDPDLVLTDISSLVTMDPRHGGLLGVVEDVSVAVRRGRVVWFGNHGDLPQPYRDLPELDCGGRLVMPGMVDAAASLLGPPSDDRPEPVVLADEATTALRRMLGRGVTSVDLRVGGGVQPTGETLRMAVARSVADRLPLEVTVTWRCAAALPGDSLRQVMAPTAARLVDAVSFSCRGDRDDLAARLAACRGLPYRIECAEPEPEACVEFLGRALSVEGVHAGGIGPTGAPPIVRWWEPGRALSHWAAGERPALATFSDPTERLISGMGMVLMTAVDLAGMRLDQAVWSVTRGGALATGDAGRGWVHLGGPADLVVVDGFEPLDLVRRPDSDTAWKVIIGGVELER
jgi:imidazolonepropionase